MTPLKIEIMLVCYYCPEPWTIKSNWDSTAAQEARNDLIKAQLIDVNWRATERGVAWVRMLLSTPLPQRSWTDPRTGQLIKGE